MCQKRLSGFVKDIDLMKTLDRVFSTLNAEMHWENHIHPRIQHPRYA